MLTGVEILLERMKTNPEEFVEGGLSKWSRVIDRAWEVLGEEERTALQDGMRTAKREHFNGEVMRVLAQGHDDPVTMDSDRLYKGKNLMQGSAIISSNSMLEKQFDEAYAENINNQVVAPQRRVK